MASFIDRQEHFTHLSQQTEELNYACTTSGRMLHVTVQIPSLQKRTTKGKERAVESDVDMLVDDDR